MRTRLMAIPILLVLVSVAGAVTQEDAVKSALAAAREKYVKDITAWRKDMDAGFEKREEAARKDGNKKALDLLAKQREEFDEKGTFPATFPADLKQKPITARIALEKAHATAVKEFLKVKKDDEAAIAEREHYAIKRIGGKWPATAVELEERIGAEGSMLAKVAGRWLDGTPRGWVCVFKVDGTFEDYTDTGKANTTGVWIMDADGNVTVNCKNGYRLIGKVAEDGAFPVDVILISSGKVVTMLPMKRDKKP